MPPHDPAGGVVRRPGGPLARDNHITARDDGSIDALESYDPQLGAAVAIVTREASEAGFAGVKLRVLRFRDDSRVVTVPGGQIARDDLRVHLPGLRSAAIVCVQPME